jgi:hypothetical protein
MMGNTFISTLQLGVQRGASIGRSVQYSQKIADGPMNMALSKRRRSYERNHELSNMITLLYH